MSVGDTCNRDVITVDTAASVHEAARLMRNHHVGDLIITRDRREEIVPVGIVTDRDLVLEVLATDLDPASVTVGDLFASSVLVTASVDDDLEATLARMREHAIRRMPIVETDGSLAGIITMDDMLQLIANQLERTVDLVVRQPDLEARRRV